MSKESVLYVISCEKSEEQSMLVGMQLKHKYKIELPERKERAVVLKQVVGDDGVDCDELAKYMQGKTIRDMKQIVMKLRRKMKGKVIENATEFYT